MKFELSRRNIAIGAVALVILAIGIYIVRYRAATGAYVNGERVLINSIDKRIENMRAKDPNRFAGVQGQEEEKAVRLMLLKEQINLRAIRQYAFKAGIEVSEAEIDKEINKMAANYSSRSEYLRQQAEQGMDETALRDLSRDQIAAIKMRTKLAREVRVNETEINDYLQHNRGEVDKVGPQVRLTVIAADNEKDVVHLGWQLESFLDPAVAIPVSALNVGGRTAPVANPDNSLSIYQLDERATRQSTEAEIRDQVRRKLLDWDQRQSFNTWLRKIEKEMNVQINI